MKSIILHIEYLIQRSDCVIIPALGALVVEHIPARFSESEGVIYPPMRVVSLNPAIRHDDGMLATSIARAEGLLFEDARLKMTEMVNALLSAIESDGEVSLGSVGRLFRGENNELSLAPYRSAAAHAADCGWAPAPLFTAKEKEETIEEVDSDSPRNNKDAVEVGPVSTSLSDLGPEMEWRACSKKNYYIPVNKIFAKCAASLVVLTLVALSFILPRRNQLPNRVEASLNPVETLMTTGRSSAGRTISENVPDSSGLNSSTSSDATPNAIGEDEQERNYLIVATFATNREADKYIQSNADCNYTLQAVKGRNVWRISAGQGDISTLRSLMNSPDFKKTFSEAWIWSDN